MRSGESGHFTRRIRAATGWSSLSRLASARSSHTFVVRPAAALRRYPLNDLVRIGHIAGFAVHAIRRVDFQLGRALLRGHLINRRGTKILAGVSELAHAA